MLAKILALFAVLFVALLVLSADAGRMPAFLRAVYDFPQGDRVGHVAIYGVLSFLMAIAFERRLQLVSLKLPIAAPFILAFAVIEEMSQALFPSRTADPVDLACSIVGVVAGAWLAMRWRKQHSSAACP